MPTREKPATKFVRLSVTLNTNAASKRRLTALRKRKCVRLNKVSNVKLIDSESKRQSRIANPNNSERSLLINVIVSESGLGNANPKQKLTRSPGSAKMLGVKRQIRLPRIALTNRLNSGKPSARPRPWPNNRLLPSRLPIICSNSQDNGKSKRNKRPSNGKHNEKPIEWHNNASPMPKPQLIVSATVKPRKRRISWLVSVPMLNTRPLPKRSRKRPDETPSARRLPKHSETLHVAKRNEKRPPKLSNVPIDWRNSALPLKKPNGRRRPRPSRKPLGEKPNGKLLPKHSRMRPDEKLNGKRRPKPSRKPPSALNAKLNDELSRLSVSNNKNKRNAEANEKRESDADAGLSAWFRNLVRKSSLPDTHLSKVHRLWAEPTCLLEQRLQISADAKEKLLWPTCKLLPLPKMTSPAKLPFLPRRRTFPDP